MHGEQIEMAKTKTLRQRPPPVVIEHLRLAYELEPKNSPEALRIKEINRVLGRSATDNDGHPTGATRLTAIRLRGSPVAFLLNEKAIGGEEFMAAQDIELAFTAISGAVGFKPLTMERVDGGQHPDWPDKTIKAVSRYKAYADHWSMRKKRGDPTLSIVIMAVIDQRPFAHIGADYRIKNAKAQTVVIRALRDYAARAGWVSGGRAAQWRAEASNSFKLLAG